MIKDLAVPTRATTTGRAVAVSWVAIPGMVLLMGCATTAPVQARAAQTSGDTTANIPSPSPSPSAAPSAPAGARTPEEKRDGLDRELDTSLAAFDAMLLKEQQAAAAKRAEEAATTGNGSGGEGEGENGGGSGGGGEKGDGKGDGKGGSGKGGASKGGGGKAGGKSGEGESGTRVGSGRDRTEGGTGGTGDDEKDRSTGSARGGSRSGGGGRVTTSAPEGQPPVGSNDADRVPVDVGDGHDDDVVARQIREAAMKEEDPAIRDKLWEEYRRYKNSQGGGN